MMIIRIITVCTCAVRQSVGSLVGPAAHTNRRFYIRMCILACVRARAHVIVVIITIIAMSGVNTAIT